MFYNIFIYTIVILLFYGFYEFYINLQETFKNNGISENKEIPKFGFIITRHVNTISTNDVWITCIKRIKKFYPDTLIVIIDDNSNYDYITYPEGLLDNCIIINSEFKGAGELLPYYYYYHNKWFEKAIYIHDSVFINGLIDISNVNNVKLIWEFPSTHVFNERQFINEYLNYLNYNDELISLFNDENKWVGCFGVMSVIKHSYIKKIADKYNLFILLDHINTRIHRMALERVFPILCFHDNEITKTDASIYGSYYNIYKPHITYDAYCDDLTNNKLESLPVKLFFGR